jgi:hypothetical protein
MTVLDRYAAVHRQGSHCASTALRTLLHGHGLPLSEDYCLGLGSGLGFTYQKYLTVDYYFFTGRNESLEENLTGLLGGRVETGRTDDPDDGWRMVKELVDAGLPVVLDLDMMYLPYLVAHLKLDKPFHFGLHNAILAGYDEPKGVAYLLDYMWNGVQEVALSDLFAARNSQTAPVKPDNGFKALILPTAPRDLAVATREAIALNVHRMREPFAFKMGLAGLKLFAREVRQWRKQLPEEQRMDNAYMAAMLFERVGTGGGNFRRMYARFLKEAAETTGIAALQDSAADYMDLFRRWRHIAKLFEAASIDPNAGMYAEDQAIDAILNELVEREYAAIDRLSNAIA